MSSEQPLARDKIAQAYLGTWGSEETQERSKARIDWLADQVEHSTVLDIGCSEGILAILLGRKGINVIGVDINPDSIEFAKNLLTSEEPGTISHVTFLCADFINSDWIGKQYEYVIIGEIIEHFAEPGTLIKKAISLLKPGGIMLVTTPFGYLPDPDHRFTFTLTSFLDFFRPEGITPITLNVENGYIYFSAIKVLDEANRWAAIDASIVNLYEQNLIKEQKLFRDRIALMWDHQRNMLSKNKTLTARVQQLLEDNKSLSEQVQQLKDDNKSLYVEIDQINTTVSRVRKEISDLFDEKQSYAKKNQELTDINNSLTNRISYRMTNEIHDAFKPVGLKTLLLPIKLVKLFIQWVKK